MGRATFARDLVSKGMLYAQLVLAGRPHARIKCLDVSAAANLPGVVAVLTAEDVPSNLYGLVKADTPVFCDQIVRFPGDRVAAVIARTPDIALAASRLVNIEYEDLPVLKDPFEAMRPEAPLLHADKPGNLAASIRLARGDVVQSFAEADVIVEHEYRTPAQEHAFLEAEAGLAYVDDQGRVTVECGSQGIHDDRRQIASALDLDEWEVRVIHKPCGGAFGGKEDISVQIILALAAWKLSHPVKMAWTREESIRGHGKRHPCWVRHKWGAQADGTITAAELDIIMDAGAYLSTTGLVLEHFLIGGVGAYDIPNVRMLGHAYFTNNNPGCAFRGMGIPQANFGAELQIEHLAETLSIDPISLRLKNCLREGSILPTQGVVPSGVGLERLLRTCAQELGAYQANGQWYIPGSPKTEPHKKRGVGFSIGFKSCGFKYGTPEGSRARVIINGGAQVEGVELHIACSEVGQGSLTTLAQIAAEELQVSLSKIEIAAGDTADIGDAGMASASRLTLFAGNAVKLAAQKAREQWDRQQRPAVGESHWRAPRTTSPDPDTGACEAALSFAYAAQAFEVEVDTQTGQIGVRNVIAAHDPGCTVNPDQATGQVQGGITQALGWTLLENIILDDCHVQTDQLSTYLIPSSVDIPASMQVIFIEVPDPLGPFGARGLGEIPFVPVAPGVVSAVRDATGEWFDAIPLTPEVVLSRIGGSGTRGVPPCADEGPDCPTSEQTGDQASFSPAS
jgi:CO/xanthine dehydrogenase Mo-binding subunit